MFLVIGVFSAISAKFSQLQLFCLLCLFWCSIIPVRTLFTYHGHIFTHCTFPSIYSIIFVTTPAPTVFPPSRMANRRPSSIATAVSIYSIIFVTTPAPTVFPPSRMANRRPSSIATAVSNSTFTFTLSPGITISAPPVKLTTPVTSVVLK